MSAHPTKHLPDEAEGTLDGDEGPVLAEDLETEDQDLLWEEGDPADRRKDPLRKP